MKQITLIAFLLFIHIYSFGQMETMPTQVFNAADKTKPLLFYISGDGGMNKFSTSLLHNFSLKGYTAVALDSRSYFWKKKEPQQAANDIGALIDQYMGKGPYHNFIIMGYSFGADVLPFIYNRFNKDLQQKTAQIILLSPSPSTDFEIHVSDMFGFTNKRAVSVPAEINKLSKPVLLVFGNDEKDYPINKITVKNKQVLVLPGGHHYDSDTDDLCNQLLQKMH